MTKQALERCPALAFMSTDCMAWQIAYMRGQGDGDHACNGRKECLYMDCDNRPSPAELAEILAFEAGEPGASEGR